MQALRKSDVQSQPAPVQADAVVERVGPRAADGAMATQSPALLLRDHLAARLGELAELKADDAAVLAEPIEAKLAIPARVAVIVGISVALWTALGVAAFALL